MSETFLENPYALLIVLGDFAFLLILFLFQRHIGKKRHRYDERYYQINNRAKARSWDTMLVILLAAWPIVIIFDGISFSFFLLTAIFVFHNLSLIITAAFVSNQEGKN
ncbi:DUF2178 domain-containing protein [Virgibacillus phasianinus]|uniref:DUF2178 domain-containing protein n=1 Tax=Virgibacillus phasianinus TaxID=2017483 RepID=A0A220TYW5_9BACI|nr:DUF3796 domain-containing protein [Virgibacillus phasianinus]ASK60881.1 DUF2178 domain-containing protein [Virgibacillus phasianinus]